MILRFGDEAIQEYCKEPKCKNTKAAAFSADLTDEDSSVCRGRGGQTDNKPQMRHSVSSTIITKDRADKQKNIAKTPVEGKMGIIISKDGGVFNAIGAAGKRGFVRCLGCFGSILGCFFGCLGCLLVAFR